ncbi:hypothetical protein GA0115240_12102 [Streptomyces sp. DvalAA-14]|nr:hypothetical protein GA0115240_12102 [Streptomyces sp. DvalAA-14]
MSGLLTAGPRARVRIRVRHDRTAASWLISAPAEKGAEAQS